MGFFGALFDFDFREFITTRVIKVLYIIAVVLIGLGTLAFLLSSLTQGGIGIIIGVVLAPLLGLVYLVMTRVYLELVLIIFRIGDDVQMIARGGGLAGGGAPAQVSGPPPAPQPQMPPQQMPPQQMPPQQMPPQQMPPQQMPPQQMPPQQPPPQQPPPPPSGWTPRV